MPIEIVIPVGKRDWKYFERQRSVFETNSKSKNSGKSSSVLEDERKSFDDELAEIKRDLLTLKAFDRDDFDDFSSMKDDFGDDFPFTKKNSSLMKSTKISTRNNDFDQFDKDFDLSKELSDMGFENDDAIFGKSKSGRSMIQTSSSTETYTSTSNDGSKSKRDIDTTQLARNISSSNAGSLSKASDRDLFIKVEHPIVETADGQKRLALRFDVSAFKPEEITVKVRGNTLSVVAEHRAETATSKTYKMYTRQYIVPKKIECDKLTSILSADGVLDIEGPAPEAETVHKIKLLPINLL